MSYHRGRPTPCHRHSEALSTFWMCVHVAAGSWFCRHSWKQASCPLICRIRVCPSVLRTTVPFASCRWLLFHVIPSSFPEALTNKIYNPNAGVDHRMNTSGQLSFHVQGCIQGLSWFCIVNFAEPRVTWQERTSTEKFSVSDWPMDMSVEAFSWPLIDTGSLSHRGCYPP